MATSQVVRKWRPPLSWIVFAVLLAVLALPIAVVIGFRALDGTTSQTGPVEIGAVVVALVITLIIALVFSRTLTGPINALVDRTEAMGRGGRSAILAPEQHGTHELAVLSQSFLDMAERLVERTDYVNSFAVHVSHELKSPLTAIRGSAELLLDEDMPAADRQRFLEHIIADTDRLAALLDRLRHLARTDMPADPKGVTLRDALAVAGGQKSALAFETEGEMDTPVALSAEAMGIVLGHLLDNAAEHGATRVTVSAERRGYSLRVLVVDNGRGVSPANRDKVFEPFFTTRRETGGTGMGLQIVRSMLAAQGGKIALLPSDMGACFQLLIPIQPVA